MIAILLLIQSIVAIVGDEGDGITTRYWDCCKPSCSWPGNVPAGYWPVNVCNNKGQVTDPNTKSVCGGGGIDGPSYMCNDQQPWTDRDGTKYGFVASNRECCSCYELLFTNGPLAGDRMLVQVTNHGGDLSQNHFDIALPGGGFGIFNGCAWNNGEPANPPPEFPDTPYDNWGQRYGGLNSRSQCSGLPQQVQGGCYWRFDEFKAADNPNVHFKQITCPAKLVAKTGCKPKSQLELEAEVE